MKKKIKKENELEKEYIMILHKPNCDYEIKVLHSEKIPYLGYYGKEDVHFMTANELKKYIELYGTDNIKHISKNIQQDINMIVEVVEHERV